MNNFKKKKVLNTLVMIFMQTGVKYWWIKWKLAS